VAMQSPGNFSAAVSGLVPGHTYEVRALVHNPLADFYGQELKFERQ